MAVVTMRQLLESGVHFGHQTRRWNPKMKRFIMTERNGIYIIDLQQSLAYIDRSYAFIKETVAKGGTVMFVGTKKQAQEAIAEQATRVGMPYVNQRWLGGMLTNFQTVHQRINRLKELDEIDFEDVAGSSRTKKELLQMRRERDKLDKSLGGIREMSRTPAAVWIVDTNKEHLAVEEARKLRIPIIGILDSNCDPDLVDFPIPGNDDAIRAVGLLTRVVADAVAEGLIARSGAKTEGAEPSVPRSPWPSGSASSCPVTPRRPPSRPPVATPPSDETPAVRGAPVPLRRPPRPRLLPRPPTEAPAAEAEDRGDRGRAEAHRAEGEYGADSAAPLEDGSAPEGFEIKGNKNSMKFHAPTSPWYARTDAEVWFKTAEAARRPASSTPRPRPRRRPTRRPEPARPMLTGGPARHGAGPPSHSRSLRGRRNMANFTAADVKKLRELTGAGMMDCKKALDEADGDFDKAVELLRVKGAGQGRRARCRARGLGRPGRHRRRRAGRAQERDRLRRQERRLRRHRPADRRRRRAAKAGDTEALKAVALGDKTVGEVVERPRHHHRREDRARPGRLLRRRHRVLHAQACRGPPAGRRRARRVRRRRRRGRPRRRDADRRDAPAVPHPRRGPRGRRRQGARDRRGDRPRGGQARAGDRQDRRGSRSTASSRTSCCSSSRRSPRTRRPSRPSSTRPA